ncbi:MAG: hypothetical protein HY744_23670 [Deltaproteobacteria bacterium]|nr:hypothetical protein [Deltaproteobacteria bacterium]
MLPYFNTAGTCIPGEHYMLPPERRLGLVMRLIDERRYFTLHAGRQTGKSTSAQWLADHYNGSGRYCALWVDIQVAREQPDPTRAFTTVLGALDTALEMYLPELGRPERESLLRDPATAVLGWLRQLARAAPRPLVVMFDEADGLVGEAMVSFLTQLRSGYLGRSKAPFPHSVVLIGMRQVAFTHSPSRLVRRPRARARPEARPGAYSCT